MRVKFVRAVAVWLATLAVFAGLAGLGAPAAHADTGSEEALFLSLTNSLRSSLGVQSGPMSGPGGSPPHERVAARATHELTALVVGTVLGRDDAGVGPRLGRSRRYNLGLDYGQGPAADRTPFTKAMRCRGATRLM